jgi:hypothetical protein
MKSSCSFTKKDARLEPEPESNIEILEPPSKRPNIMRPTQGQVTIEIPVSKPKPLGSGSRGVDLSDIVSLLRGLMEVGILIQRELQGQCQAAEAHVKELRKHRKAMVAVTHRLDDIGGTLDEWMMAEEDMESGKEEEKEKEKEKEPESNTELDMESESEKEKKAVEKETDKEVEQEQEQEPEKEPAKEIDETIDMTQ